jgi:voltage-gated potassium channel Kch
MVKIFWLKGIHFGKLIFELVFSVPFITISMFGNTTVFIFATLFYYLEHDVNPRIVHYIDALWWSFATTTTVGYGDIVPITIGGKIIGIFLMLVGVAIFGIYTALFARAILDDEVYMQ